MTDPDLFQPHSETSREAAERIRPAKGALHAKIMGHLERGPDTDEGIAIALEMNPSTARPRRIELVRAGMLRQAGTSITSSGRRAALWELAL